MSSSSANLVTLVRQRKWEDVLNRIALFPDQASQPTTINFLSCGTSCRALPIHGALLASRGGTPAPQHVIRALISAFPDSLRTKDSLGRLPLHYAARYGTSIQLTYILALYPQGACVTSDDGALPLMLACLHGDSADKVVALLEAYPEAANSRDNSGLSTFEYACDNPRPIKVDFMRLILESQTNHSNSNERPTQVVPAREEDGGGEGEGEVEEEVEAETEIKPGTKLCCVCMELAVSVCLVPCGHTILCSRCSSRHGLSRMDYKCPECRSHVEQAIKIFARIADD